MAEPVISLRELLALMAYAPDFEALQIALQRRLEKAEREKAEEKQNG